MTTGDTDRPLRRQRPIKLDPYPTGWAGSVDSANERRGANEHGANEQGGANVGGATEGGYRGPADRGVAGSGIELVVADGLRVAVGRGFDRQALAELLAALRGWAVEAMP